MKTLFRIAFGVLIGAVAHCVIYLEIKNHGLETGIAFGFALLATYLFVFAKH